MKQEGDDCLVNILVCLLLVYVANCYFTKKNMFSQRKLGTKYMSYHFCMDDGGGGGGGGGGVFIVVTVILVISVVFVFVVVVLTGSSCL